MTLASHNELPDNQHPKGLNLAQWIRTLSIMYNGYSMVGLKKASNQAGTQVVWCNGAHGTWCVTSSIC